MLTSNVCLKMSVFPKCFRLLLYEGMIVARLFLDDAVLTCDVLMQFWYRCILYHEGAGSVSGEGSVRCDMS